MKKAAIAVTAIAVLLVAAAAAFVHIYLTEARIKSLIIPPAEKALGRKVEIGGVSVSLFSGIEVRDLRVAGADGRNVFASLGSLVIKYRLFPLLRKKIEISRIILERPMVRVSRDRKGRFNFSTLAFLAAPAANGRPAPAGGGSSPDFALGIEKIAVRDGRLLVADQTGVIPATEAGFDLDMKVALAGGAPRFSGTARATVKSVYGGLPIEARVKKRFDQDQARADVDLDIGGERVKITATVKGYLNVPRARVTVSAGDLAVERLMALAGKPAVSPPPDGGGDAAAAQPAPPPALPQVTGRIVIKRLTYMDLAANNVDAAFHTDGARVVIDRFGLATCKGRIDGKAVLTLGEPLAYQGKVTAGNISIAALREGLRQKGGGIADGLASADAVFSGRGIAWPALADHLDASGSYGIRDARITRNPYTELLATALGRPNLAEVRASVIKGQYRVEKGRMWLDGAMKAREMTLAGKGSIGLAAADLDFRLTAAVTAARAGKPGGGLAGALAGSDGTVRLGLTLRGTATSPKLAIDRDRMAATVKNQARKRAAGEAEKLIGRELGDRPEAALARDAAGALLDGLFGGR